MTSVVASTNGVPCSHPATGSVSGGDRTMAVAPDHSQFVIVDPSDLSASSGSPVYTGTTAGASTEQSWVVVEDPNPDTEEDRQRRATIAAAQDEAITRQVLTQQRRALTSTASGEEISTPSRETHRQENQRSEGASATEEELAIARIAARAEDESRLNFEARQREDERATAEYMEKLKRSEEEEEQRQRELQQQQRRNPQVVPSPSGVVVTTGGSSTGDGDGGAAADRRCDCLGASGGIHRKDCPLVLGSRHQQQQ